MKQVKAEGLEPGDVVVIIWHDATLYQNTPKYFNPDNVGTPGLRRLEVGVVVTNGNGWLRVAKELTYVRAGEDMDDITIKNTYCDMPWGWEDVIYHCGSVKKVLLDVWEKAKG